MQSIAPKLTVSTQAPTEIEWGIAHHTPDSFRVTVPDGDYAYLLSAQHLEFVDQYGFVDGWQQSDAPEQLRPYLFVYRTVRPGLGTFETRIRRRA